MVKRKDCGDRVEKAGEKIVEMGRTEATPLRKREGRPGGKRGTVGKKIEGGCGGEALL